MDKELQTHKRKASEEAIGPKDSNSNKSGKLPSVSSITKQLRIHSHTPLRQGLEDFCVDLLPTSLLQNAFIWGLY